MIHAKTMEIQTPITRRIKELKKCSWLVYIVLHVVSVSPVSYSLSSQQRTPRLR